MMCVCHPSSPQLRCAPASLPALNQPTVRSGTLLKEIYGHRTRRWLGALWLTVLVSLAWAPAAQAQSKEEIQSALIFNFARFVTWPETAFANASAPVRLVFVGADALATAFADVVRGKNVNGREFEIVKGGTSELSGAHIVFVGDAGKFAPVTAAIAGKPTLAVGEAGFLDGGGMIAMQRDGAKIVFEIDVGVTKAAGLEIDPRLLRIAKTVKGQ